MGSRRRKPKVQWNERAQRWEGWVDFGWKLDGKRDRRVATSRLPGDRGRREAQAKFDSLLADLETGHRTVGNLTVGDILRTWLDDGAPSSRGRKEELDGPAWSVQHISASIGKLRYDAIRNAEPIERMLGAKARAGLGERSLKMLRTHLAQAIDEAIRRGDTTKTNWARVARLPDPAKVKYSKPKEPRAMTLDEAKALLATAKGNRLYALCVVGLMLGLRPGELLGLRWSAVDFEDGVLYVESTKSVTKGVRDRVKTEKSRAGLGMPRPVIDALKAHRAEQAQERLAAGERWQDHGLVFCTREGAPLEHRNLRRWFGAMTKKAGIGNWAPGSMRHSAATILRYEVGLQPEEIVEVLRHADDRMLRKHYMERQKIVRHTTAMERVFAS